MGFGVLVVPRFGCLTFFLVGVDHLLFLCESKVSVLCNLMLLYKLIMKLVSCCFSMSCSLYLSAGEIYKGGDWE